MQALSICFLGGGNMADALIGGLLAAGHDRGCITVIEADAQRAEDLRQRHDVLVLPTGSPLPESALVVLAVKPQQAAEALAQTPPPASSVLLSIAAGLTCDWLARQLAPGVRIVRCMPNTPARVGEGATGLWAGDDVDAETREAAEYVLRAAGATVWLQSEAQMDIVTALSGSGPAYVFALTEAMTDGAVALGLPRETAETLARQTVIGAGQLMASESTSAGALRQRVTSRGGTTEAALARFAAADLGGIVADAMRAAFDRARELAAPDTDDAP